jgi:membrane protein YqaA with SNARE-associated domain
MTILLFSIKSFLTKWSGHLEALGKFIATFGAPGLFVICVLDSTFVPLPSSADALLIFLSIKNPHLMLFYVLLAVAGSTVGLLILYYISRRAGQRALARFSPAKQKRVKDWIDKYDMLSVLVACMMPPPFPLKLFVITAGVFRFSVARFIAAIVIGRILRFGLLGYFAIRYGSQAMQMLQRYYPWIGLGLAILIVIFFVMRSLLKRKPEQVEEASLETGA